MHMNLFENINQNEKSKQHSCVKKLFLIVNGSVIVDFNMIFSVVVDGDDSGGGVKEDFGLIKRHFLIKFLSFDVIIVSSSLLT
ncbi:hypothetical protein DERP_000671 [Dermatophagoides pteronyssinus]|uniref:Transmembrane protein n=1 Tax=Dermatophagoides pteronyssinus TaxID=6956 RepID=A0ABQ8J0U1_DERPT|nr:hypothetical protein DERP_000671 [Dermatophagoides pteronyssinus]